MGTKTTGTETSEYEVEVPFETEIQFDDTMEAGTQETVQEGKPGKDKVTTTKTIENSKVVDTKTETERVTEPVKKIIKVGTKGKPASTQIEWTEQTPFGVEVRINPELQPGETKVVQEGKPGEVKHSVGVEVDDKGNVTKGEPKSETVKEPVKQIIEVGPAKDHESTLIDKHTEKTPYDTIIEYDPSLEVGKVVEDQAGAFGEKEITKTWKLKNGKPVGDPETSEKVVKDPQPRKIRVGSKCNCDKPTEEPTQDPTEEPTEDPTEEPSQDPSEEPTQDPTEEPSQDPSEEPSQDPTEEPSQDPSEEPSQDPTEEPSQDPSEEPSQDPSEEPSKDPSDKPNEPGNDPGQPGKPGDDPSQPGKPGDDPSQPSKPGDKPNEPGKPGDKPSEGAQAPGTSGGDGNKPADSSGTGSSPLPRTGVSIAGTLAAAAVLIAGGVGLLAVRRRPSKR